MAGRHLIVHYIRYIAAIYYVYGGLSTVASSLLIKCLSVTVGFILESSVYTHRDCLLLWVYDIITTC